jgi:hypothetical protein
METTKLLKEIIQLIETNPNDSDLGKAIRKLYTKYKTNSELLDTDDLGEINRSNSIND